MSFDLKIVGGDLVKNTNNDLSTVRNVDKLTQDILKVVQTQLGSNPFFPWYGSPISKSLVGRAYDSNFVSAIASQQLRSSLETLQQLQKVQMLKTDQLVTAEEQIGAIQGVKVEQNVADPRYYKITIAVVSKAFQTIYPTLNISL